MNGANGWTVYRENLKSRAAFEASWEMRTRYAHTHQGPSPNDGLTERPDISMQSNIITLHRWRLTFRRSPYKRL